MTPDERKAFIEKQLTETFSPKMLEVIDESHKHIGHAGNQTGASHFALTIEADVFKGKRLIESHRMIYALFADLIPQEIHALRIKVI